MLLRYWQRIVTSVQHTAGMVTRTIWKWSGCRWAMGAIVLYLLYTALATPRGHPMHLQELHYEERPALPRPPDQIAVFDVPDEYHKRVRVYMGTHMAIAMLDAGSFRNCTDSEVLKDLEEKQRKRE